MVIYFKAAKLAHKLIFMQPSFKSLSLIFWLIFCLSNVFKTQAQLNLSLQIDATNHPNEFLFFEGSTFHKAYDLWPKLEARLGVKQVMGKKKLWRWQTDLSYRYARLDAGEYGQFNFPDKVDPFYGFVRQTGDPALDGSRIFETYHWLGLQAGVAYRFNRNKGWKNFWLGVGAMLQMPIASYSHFGHSRTSQTNNQHIDFYDYYTFYGFYLQPSYEFNLAKNGRSNWSLGVFARANAILRSQHASNPFFSGGGVFSLNCRLKK